MRQAKRNKLTSNFSSKPYKVIKKTGPQITAQRKDGHTVTRNVSHYKRVKKFDNEDDTDDECFDNSETTPQNNQPVNNNDDHEQPPPTLRSSRLSRPPQRFGQELPSNLIGSFKY